MRNLIYLVLLLFLAMAGIAEEWMTFTTDDGLAHNICRCVAVDHDGVVWVGHGDVFSGVGGVSSWDGETWTTYHSWTTDFALRSDYINDIAVDENNNKWFSTGTITYPGGITKFDGNEWTRFDFDTLVPGGEYLYSTSICFVGLDMFFNIGHYIIHIPPDSIPLVTTFDHGILDIYSGFSNIYLGTRIGLYLYGYPTCELVDSTSDFAINCITRRGDSLFLATEYTGIIIISDFSLTRIDTSNSLISNNINKIYLSNDSILWVGSDRGISKLEESTWIDYRVDISYTSNVIFDIIEDLNENIWIMSLAGVFVYNKEFIIWNIEEYPDYSNICSNKKPDISTAEILYIFDINGRLVDRLPSYKKIFNLKTNNNSGIYFLTYVVNDTLYSQKAIFIK